MCELDGGVALLDLDRNVYFSLNRTGAVIWRAIEKPSSIDDVCAAVADKFTVTRDDCRGDVVSLVDRLVDSRLARVVDAAAG